MTLMNATVNGSVLFSDAIPEGSVAVAHILVEEVTRSDAPATAIARLEIPGVIVQEGRHHLPFSLKVEGIDPAKRYIVRVHIDMNGDGRISPGDHVSTESYPVMTQGAPNHVQVHVCRI